MPCFTSEKTRVFVVSEPRRLKYNSQTLIGKGSVGTFVSPARAHAEDAVLANARHSFALRYPIKPRKFWAQALIRGAMVIGFQLRNSC